MSSRTLPASHTLTQCLSFSNSDDINATGQQFSSPIILLLLSTLLLLFALQIVSVDAAAGVLVLGGVDVVDGSPVLDIKPYVPFSDALPGAAAPDWVAVGCKIKPIGSQAALQL